MRPSEVFNDAIYGDHTSYGGYCSPVSNYWDIEMAIARTMDTPYSSLEDYREPEDRTCGICGALYGTAEHGGLPACSNQECSELRTYWQFTAALCKPARAVGNWRDAERKARSNWFTRALKDHFGVSTIIQLDKAIRLDALLTLRLMREAIEHKQHTSGSVERRPEGCAVR